MFCFVHGARGDKSIGLGISQSVDGELALGLQGEWDSIDVGYRL